MFRGLSPLEGGGFEPSVPRVDTLWFRAPRRSPGVSWLWKSPSRPTDLTGRDRAEVTAAQASQREIFLNFATTSRDGVWVRRCSVGLASPDRSSQNLASYPTVEPQCLHRPKPSSRGANVNDRDSYIHHGRVLEVRLHLPTAESPLRTCCCAPWSVRRWLRLFCHKQAAMRIAAAGDRLLPSGAIKSC